MRTDDTIDLDVIVRRLRSMGVNAHVAQTGGGVATIYAGKPYIDDNGDHRYPIAAGPGTYSWGRGPSTAHLGEFFVGPDDDGEAFPVEPIALGAKREGDVARIIRDNVIAAAKTNPETTR